ncbi:unnamed protein product [Mytilus coruscus]|uniref:Uncharacterized protein n=1 Tax=Mytilus coruscus TaxID=42192 RepID=A0A6J8B8R0_MYTCO|nr:unnamed protein product [Mytilus coruscus]
MVSKEEENFLRIVYLNYSVATRALTRFFDKLHSNLSADLHIPRNKAKLKQLLNPPPGRKRVLYQGQWDILYPPTGTPKVTSADLDLTLIVCLLRNLPPVVVAPVNGFDELPNPYDKSDGANIARLKYYKNFLVSHSKDGSISNVDFVGMWNTLEQAIKGLDNSKASIASLKDARTKMLDNSMAQLLSTQIQLETKVSNLQDDLEQISIYIDKDVKEKTKMKQPTTNLEEIIKLKGCNLERLFNKSEENKDMIDILYERLNSSEVKGLTTKSELLQNEWIKQEKDHIPSHIRAQHEQEISDWEQDKNTFVETRATDHILESLHSNHCIVVTGSSGCGKSSNIHHAALYLRDRYGYEIIPVFTGPSDITNYYKRNKPQVFVVDDICGKETISKLTLQIWRDYSENLEKLFSNEKNKTVNTNPSEISGPKLLISCRLHIYKESQFQRITLLAKKECNILSSDLCLLPKERMFIMQKYLPDNIIDTLMPLVGDLDFFPLLCKMSKNKTYKEVKKLFTDPVYIIQRNIQCIISESKLQFCAIVLCITFDGGFKTDWLKLTSAPETKRAKLEYIVNEFDIDLTKEMSRNYLKDGFRTLNGTYLKQRGTEYRMIHDKIYKMAAIICGQQLTECFIKYTPSVFIRDHFIFESVTEVQTNDDLIAISKDQEKKYFERLLRDLKQHVITSTFHNSQLIFHSFIEKLISFFLQNDDAKALLNKLEVVVGVITKDDEQNMYRLMSTFTTTPLIEAAAGGYFEIAKFLIVDINCDVNKCDSYGSRKGRSALYMASERGHSDVVKLLLKHNAEVSRCNEDRESSLFVACKRGHTDSVKQLLQGKADVYQCNCYGESPLFVACKGGHTDIVKLLLKNNADVILCNDDEESPLFVACDRGHKDIVELLLQNKADVSQCNIYKYSPLYVACQRGRTDIVKLLLQNGADVSECYSDGDSPLFVACEEGHTETLEFLLQNNSKFPSHDIDGVFLLYVACIEGHDNTVEMLLKYNAIFSQWDIDGDYLALLLCVASNKGHDKTVDILLTCIADYF